MNDAIEREVTAEELKGLLLSRKGANFVSFESETDARLRKTGNPFGEVRKTSKVNGVINWEYAGAVNRQREREGRPVGDDGEVELFEPKPRKWGTRIKGTPFVENNGKLYVEVKVERTLAAPTYRDADGHELTAEQVAPFMPKRKKSSRQGVDKEVVLRDYSLGNIRRIKVNGEAFVVRERKAGD